MSLMGSLFYATPQFGRRCPGRCLSAEERDLWFGYDGCCINLSRRLGQGHMMQNQVMQNQRRTEGVLLFLHGRSETKEMWTPLIGHFEHRFSCISYDLPGFGKSLILRDRYLTFKEQTVLVGKVLDYFCKSESEPVFLVGHDIGANLAAAYSTETRQRPAPMIRGLVLMSPSPLVRLVPSLYSCYRRLFRRYGRPRALAILEETWPDQVERISTPALLLAGGKDRVNTSRTASEVLRYFLDGVLSIHERRDNQLNSEATDWVIEKIEKFLFNLSLFRPFRKFL